MNCPICNEPMTPIYDDEERKFIYICPTCGEECEDD